MLLLETMGCGRSKLQSNTSLEEAEKDHRLLKRHSKSRKKADKGNRIGDKKENKEPLRQHKSPLISKDNESAAALEVNGTAGIHPYIQGMDVTFVHNGQTDSAAEVTRKEHSPVKEQHVKTAFKDKPSGNLYNSKITRSQIEFFRMLDEKIAQGKDYSSEDET